MIQTRLSVYLELIRIIERDIDEIVAGDTRNGWTSWGIAAGIAAALMLLFSETRKLASFPTIAVEQIGLAGVLLYNVAVLGLRVLSFDQGNIRPGKLRWSNEAYFAFVPSAVFSLLILILSFFLAATLILPLSVKIVTLAAFGLWSLWTIFLLAFSRMEFPLGNNRVSRKSGRIISVATLLLSALAMLAMGSQLRFPVGEEATLPYIIAGIILVVLVLIGNLVFTVAPSRLLSNLKDLRNEIVFLRIEIDEALRRYEVISEGESLPDAIQKELSEILTDLNVIEYAHWNMHRLIEQMTRKLPGKDELVSTRDQKTAELGLDKDSYYLHEAKCTDITNSLGPKVEKLTKKMSRVSAATEDWGSENTIRASLTERLQLMQRVETQLKQRRNAVDYYLINPDKIPQELKVVNDDTQKGAINMPRLRRLSSRGSQSYPSRMATIVEVKKLALDLPEKERAVLAANLLESLPGVLWDEDDGVAEALRRDAQMDADPDQVISLAQLDSHIQNRRG
jgi:hypothetical protein